ncbi:hypothetical protein [Pedococcus dokdonensis]|nr:hypothetical protein [Pedococcus dokdonensis]
MLGYDNAEDDNPKSAGTRKVQRALASLHREGFIVRTPRPGRVDLIEVHHVAGKFRPPYVTIPLDLWVYGWINVLPGHALFAYLVLRHACAGDETREVHVAPYIRSAYGLSDETWAKGTKSLVRFGLLTERLHNPDDRDLPRRQRKVYKLRSSAMGSVATVIEPDRPRSEEA